MALVIWRDRWLHGVFFASSFAFGAVVLLAHLHYTIDVTAAFFIAYGIFRIVERRFESRQWKLDPLRTAKLSFDESQGFLDASARDADR